MRENRVQLDLEEFGLTVGRTVTIPRRGDGGEALNFAMPLGFSLCIYLTFIDFFLTGSQFLVSLSSLTIVLAVRCLPIHVRFCFSGYLHLIFH